MQEDSYPELDIDDVLTIEESQREEKLKVISMLANIIEFVCVYVYVRARNSSPSPDKIRTKLSNVRIKMPQILIHFPINLQNVGTIVFKCCCEHWYMYVHTCVHMQQSENLWFYWLAIVLFECILLDILVGHLKPGSQ